MLILDKLIKKPGIKVDELLGEFSQKQIEGIYPALSQVMLEALLEELELMGYLEYKGAKIFTTQKANEKLIVFKNSLSTEEKQALEI